APPDAEEARRGPDRPTASGWPHLGCLFSCSLALASPLLPGRPGIRGDVRYQIDVIEAACPQDERLRIWRTEDIGGRRGVIPRPRRDAGGVGRPTAIGPGSPAKKGGVLQGRSALGSASRA